MHSLQGFNLYILCRIQGGQELYLCILNKEVYLKYCKLLYLQELNDSIDTVPGKPVVVIP